MESKAVSPWMQIMSSGVFICEIVSQYIVRVKANWPE